MSDDKHLYDLLPDYVGFGVLDHSSLCTADPSQNNTERSLLGLKDRHVRALYRTEEGDVVYRLEINEGSCFVEELYNGEALAFTRCDTIRQVFIQKFLTCNWGEHPRMEALRRRCSEGRNITFEDFSRRVMRRAYLPHGMIFGLFLPVDSRPQLDSIRETAGSLGLDGVFPGTIIKVADDFSVTLEDREVAVIPAGLLDLEDTVRFCFDKGLVSVDGRQEMGLHVVDLQHIEPGSFTAFEGRGGGLRLYTCLLRREGDISLNEALRRLENEPNVRQGETGTEDPNPSNGYTLVHIFDDVGGNKEDKSWEMTDCGACTRPGNLSMVNAYGRRILVCTGDCRPLKLAKALTDPLQEDSAPQEQWDCDAHDGYGWDYRPHSYWVGPRTARINIMGEMRRRKIEQSISDGEVEDIPEEILKGELSEETRLLIGAMHPSNMGGEYLPPYLPGEVEIARVCLKSVTWDVISIRAVKRSDRMIHYRVVDEYEDQEGKGFTCLPESTERPLTFREIVSLIDGVEIETYAGVFRKGLASVYRDFNYEMDPGKQVLDELVDFVTVRSDFYPELGRWYQEEAMAWHGRRLAELTPEDERDDPL